MCAGMERTLADPFRLDRLNQTARANASNLFHWPTGIDSCLLRGDCPGGRQPASARKMPHGKNAPRARQSDLTGWVRFVTSTLVLSVLMASGMMFSQHLAKLESVTLLAPGQPTLQRDRPHPEKHSINVQSDGSLVFDDLHNSNQNDISSTDADEMRIPESELWQPAVPSVAQMPKSSSSSKSTRKKRRKEKKSSFSKVGVYGRGFTTVFLHIHKGGGTTLCYLARKRERALFDANCNLNNRPDRLTLAAGTAEDFSAVVDKFRDEENRTFLASEWFLPAQLPKREDIKYITMLRNPLARMESHFHMAFEQAARALKSSPKKNCRYTESLPAWQTIRLIDEDMEVASSTRELFALNTPDNWQTRAVCGPACAQVPFGKLTEEHFQIAKDRLENDFAIVGIIEHFQETITMFHGLLQWDGEVSDIFSEHHGTHHGGNTVLKRLELEAAGNPRLQNFAKWWHAVNQFDIRLYNIGRELFHKQATAEGLQVEMGPEISLDFVAPQGEVTPAAALRSMLEADVNTRKCTTQCCSQDCAPIGKFWRSTAIDLGMAPRRKC